MEIKNDNRFLQNNSFFENYEIGEYTYGVPVVRDSLNGAILKIGKFCSIADGVVIFVGKNKRGVCVSTYPFDVFFGSKKTYSNTKISDSAGDVVIGNDVWIGSGVTIMSGVIIGDGAIVGARSVVSKNIPPYGIAVGAPAKIKKYRFEKDYIDRLLKVKWWDFPEKEILGIRDLFSETDVQYFLTVVEKIKCRLT